MPVDDSLFFLCVSLCISNIIIRGWHHQLETISTLSFICISLMLQLNIKPIKHLCSLIPLAAAPSLSAVAITTLGRRHFFQPNAPFTHKVSLLKCSKSRHQSHEAGWHLHDIGGESDPQCIHPGLTFKARLSCKPACREEKWQPAPANKLPASLLSQGDSALWCWIQTDG